MPDDSNDIKANVAKLNELLAILPRLTADEMKQAQGQEIEGFVILGGSCQHPCMNEPKLLIQVNLKQKKQTR
jgi:hypothetical protein